MTKTMRVLHINCNYLGNALHQIMIEHLDELGYDNRVFVPTYNKDSAVIEPNDNVKVCECFKKWDRLIFDYKQRKIRKGIERNFAVKDFTAIHAYTLFTDGNCARKLSKQTGIPYVVTVRNTDVNVFLRLMPHLRGRGVQIMRDASFVCFLSKEYQRHVFEKYIPAAYQEEILEKTRVIPNGIDAFWLQNPPESDKKMDKKAIKLIYAGGIDRNKNILTTQKAMELLRKWGYPCTLTVVGSVRDKKVFRTIQKDASTTCLPAMKKEELIHLYRQSDIFVMPSYTESFGLVYAEAMSQGLPVIYSRGQGFDCQFQEGTVGYHVSAEDPGDVADGIRRVIDSYEDIQKNVICSAEVFDWTKIAKEYDGIYQAMGVSGK